MHKNIVSKLRFVLFVMLVMTGTIRAAAAEETTVEFISTNATMEDDPNHGVYNITIFSPDGQWKMQLNYHADSMFGTFGNDDFNLSGNGKNYNYVRNPKNDMVFYSFKDMQVTVSNEGTCIKVDANCLTTNNMRFIVQAGIDIPQPTSTTTDNLGYARVEENAFYGSWAIYAENENYKLGYGIVSDNLLGTFYRADLLLPELFDKKANKKVGVVTATAEHTKEGDNTIFKIDILGEDHKLYKLTMFNGPYDLPMLDEKTVDIHGVVLQDLTDYYGCYQFGGMNEDYGMALALKPDAVTEGRTSWTREDCVMQYTKLVTMPDQTSIDIFDITAELDVTGKSPLLKAEVKGMDQVLYHINMYMDSGAFPEASETVNLDFGHVRMLDYSKGLGAVGIGAVLPDQAQMRFYLYTDKLEGEFETGDFFLDMCDVMVVNGGTFSFHDAKYVKATMQKDGDRTLITADMYCVNDVLYHATMYIDPLSCMSDGEYSVDMTDNVAMVSIQDGGEDDYYEYLLQLQDLDDALDEEDNIVGNGSCFSFYFGHDGVGVAGEYGYSAGTLDENNAHTFYENGCEVRVAAVAGILTLTPTEKVSIKLSLGEADTYLYNIAFQFVGQNGVMYKGEGSNALICLDVDGNLVDIDETALSIINNHLQQSGQRVRKVLKNGVIVIEKQERQFDLTGKQLR